MVPFRQHARNYYYSGVDMIRRSSYGAFRACDYKPIKPKRSREESKKLAAINHSLAERNRRMRINNQYDNLRRLFRNNEKRDKASLLAATIEIVNRLKETGRPKEEASSSKKENFPSWENRWNLRREEGLMKATLNCEDKKELMSTIDKALRSVEAKMMKAEMAFIEGRTRIVLWVKDSSNGGNKCEEILKRTLSALIQRPAHRRRRYNQ